MSAVLNMAAAMAQNRSQHGSAINGDASWPRPGTHELGRPAAQQASLPPRKKHVSPFAARQAMSPSDDQEVQAQRTRQHRDDEGRLRRWAAV